MFLLGRLFRRSPIKKLLGGGLVLSDGQQKFYVDSETYIGLKQRHVTFFREQIRKILNNNYNDTSEITQLTDLEKNKIALNTKKILESEGFDVFIFPELPLEFQIKNK